MDQNRTIGYITVDSNFRSCEIKHRQIKSILPWLNFVQIDSIDNLYRILVNVNFDFIIIDIEYLCGVQCGYNPIEQLRSLQLAIAHIKVKTKILCRVGENTPAEKIRIIEPEISGLIIDSGDNWNTGDVIKDTIKYIKGDFSIPKLITQRLAENPRRKRTFIVSPTSMISDPELSDVYHEIGRNYNIEYFTAPQLSWIYHFLDDPNFPLDVVAIDLDYLYSAGGSDAIIKIQTLMTLISSAEYRENGRHIPRAVSILGAVSLTTDTKLIRDFINIKGVAGIFPLGHEFTKDEKSEAVEAQARREFHIPQRIREKLTAKNKRRQASGTISLTAREGQIYNIIVERGASNKHIARMLGVSEPTVKMHVGKILKKYGLRNRTQLVSFKKSTEV